MAELAERYADLGLGGTDASLVALAERLGLTTLATFDRRHFTVVRPAHTRASPSWPPDPVPASLESESRWQTGSSQTACKHRTAVRGAGISGTSPTAPPGGHHLARPWPFHRRAWTCPFRVRLQDQSRANYPSGRTSPRSCNSPLRGDSRAPSVLVLPRPQNQGPCHRVPQPTYAETAGTAAPPEAYCLPALVGLVLPALARAGRTKPDTRSLELGVRLVTTLVRLRMIRSGQRARIGLVLPPAAIAARIRRCSGSIRPSTGQAGAAARWLVSGMQRWQPLWACCGHAGGAVLVRGRWAA
jgi:hypothetical protein